MFSKIWLMNFALAVCVAFLGFKAYGVWHEGHEPGVSVAPGDLPRAKSENAAVKGVDRKRLPGAEAFETVATKNLFSPDRTDVKEDETSGTDPLPILSAEVEKNLKGMSLYGVIIADGYQKAMVVDKTLKRQPVRRRTPVPAPGQGETLWVRVGDVVGDFKVAAIAPDKISLEAGGGSYDLFLHDTENPKSRPGFKTASGPSVVIQTGGAPSPPVAPAGPVSTPVAAPQGGTSAAAGGSAAAAGAKGIAPAATQSGQATRNPFQQAITGKKSAATPVGPKDTAVETRNTNPFLKALQDRGALPK
jgi:hypothetical protein